MDIWQQWYIAFLVYLLYWEDSTYVETFLYDKCRVLGSDTASLAFLPRRNNGPLGSISRSASTR